MNIPVLGLVENMSYVTCPDCKTVIHPFGESHIENIAEKHKIETTAEIPIERDLSRACDGGVIELFEGDWLNGLADKLEETVKKEK
jgi:hypothetical protein